MWYYAFWAGVIPLIGASAFYAALLLRRRVVLQAVTEAGIVSVTSDESPPGWIGGLASFLLRFSAAFLALSLVLRAAATGRPPFSNMWEYLVSFGAVTVVLYALFERRYREPRLALGVLPVALVLFALAEWLFSSRITPLVPALQNNRLLTIHVALMLLSYGALAVAFGAAVLYLVQDGGQRFRRLPSAAICDDLGHRAVLVGFPLLAAGIALGAYWGNIAWGRYWGWDPKETTALVTWLVFAGYLHTRGLAQWRGKRAAWLIIVGFAMIVFNIFAVNFWIAGLHSYA